MGFIHANKCAVPCPEPFLVVGLLMDGEMLMMTLGKPTLGPARPVSLCLRLLRKCHGVVTEASSHLQLHGIQPKVGSFASAGAWQGGSAQPQPWLRWIHATVATLQGYF